MGRIAFVGGGIVGMCAAIMLARDGHDVTVLERDPATAPSPDTAWDEWERRGVNQFTLSFLNGGPSSEPIRATVRASPTRLGGRDHRPHPGEDPYLSG